MLTLGVVGFVLLAVVAWVCAHVSPIPAESLKMGAYEAVFAGGVVIAALYRQFDERHINVPIYLVLSGLAAICTAMLWYRKDSYFAWIPTPWHVKPAWAAFAMTGLFFLISATYTYPLPHIGNETLGLFEAIQLGFALFGLLWLPGLATLIGLKAILRDIQSQPL
jgi:hypothetical protein